MNDLSIIILLLGLYVQFFIAMNYLQAIDKRLKSIEGKLNLLEK